VVVVAQVVAQVVVVVALVVVVVVAQVVAMVFGVQYIYQILYHSRMLALSVVTLVYLYHPSYSPKFVLLQIGYFLVLLK
jgi:hypothetical protein